MKINFDVGDTNFIAIVNSNQYKTFVSEDWDLGMLRKHFIEETKEGNILVMQMTEEGIESNWNIEIKNNENFKEQLCFRKSEGYIKVDDGCLYLVEYTCITMAAQFKDDIVPDEYCSNYKINLKNGIYKVDIIQFFDVDNNKHVGIDTVDMILNFIEVFKFEQVADDILWYSY